MKKRFTEEQIVRVLAEAEAEAGMAVPDVCRKHNVSEQSFYRWKAKYGGIDVSEVKRLKELERENRELKQIVAEQVGRQSLSVLTLDNLPDDEEIDEEDELVESWTPRFRRTVRNTGRSEDVPKPGTNQWCSVCEA